MLLGEPRAVFVDHCTHSALEFVRYLTLAMSHTQTIYILLLQIIFSYMCLHSSDPRDKKEAWMARSEGRQWWIIWSVQKFFSTSDPAQIQAPVLEKAAHPTQRNPRKSKRRFLIDDAEEDDIIVVWRCFQSILKKNRICCHKVQQRKRPLL